MVDRQRQIRRVHQRRWNGNFLRYLGRGRLAKKCKKISQSAACQMEHVVNLLNVLAMAEISFRSLILFSALFRIFLILYGEWQDAVMEVRYTDIDYFVFSDAAALMASGKSPYKRSTYRYSPLIAFLLMPNSFLHQSWGKFLFSASDLLVGSFIHKILKLRGVPGKLCTYSTMAWLINPFTFTIGTRGNCEPIVCAMILWILLCLMMVQLQSLVINFLHKYSLTISHLFFYRPACEVELTMC